MCLIKLKHITNDSFNYMNSDLDTYSNTYPNVIKIMKTFNNIPNRNKWIKNERDTTNHERRQTEEYEILGKNQILNCDKTSASRKPALATAYTVVYTNH